MKKFSHKKGWGTDANTAHVESPPIPVIKETFNDKSDGDYVKLKLCRYPTSSTSDLYEFRLYLFDHGKQEEFLLLFWNFKTTLAATGALEMEAKLRYICTLVRG